MCRDNVFYEMLVITKGLILLHMCVFVVCVRVHVLECTYVIIELFFFQQEANHAASHLQATPVMHVMICDVLNEI